MPLSYQDALGYMYNHLPMFHRVGSAAYKNNLDNTFAIDRLLNHPHWSFKSIHIAGTNGKGSVSHSIASILQQAGYKTGLYTSPHLKDFRERIKINGKKVSKKYVTEFISQYQKDFEIIKPSFFEMTVGMAFQYFKEKKVDIAIIETGLGGRLDSTNIIQPLVSVITNISKDHVTLLGNDLVSIAGEKAGIIKNNTPVVIGKSQPEVSSIFIDKAKVCSAPIFFSDQNFCLKSINKQDSAFAVYEGNTLVFKKVCPQLKGIYQQENILTVLQTVKLLQKAKFNIRKKDIKAGIEKVVDNTGLYGRWQVIHKKPLIIADTGHNEAGISFVLKQINSLSYQKLHFVLGMVNDKDVTKILSMLPKNAEYYFCKANIPRGMQADTLAQEANIFNLRGKVYGSVRKALNAAKKQALTNDLIFVGGSTFTVAEII
ncbi:MAG: bifunctional folylpolyglutamate synthase/dihydrofolate synthase [Bacteroidia bacterium]|nr:bifunctional folylpolyglutamate synthase/dihydrofolate synthase [Bacteroidia bacterium]MCZ2248981.1 bifunctional folylpolyglutamate synthase/dihydrofolate synthase [Bacteroidia bacterium]